MLVFNTIKISEACFDLTSLVDMSDKEDSFDGDLIIHPESLTHAKFV